jgi:translation elongation factor EF-Ts
MDYHDIFREVERRQQVIQQQQEQEHTLDTEQPEEDELEEEDEEDEQKVENPLEKESAQVQEIISLREFPVIQKLIDFFHHQQFKQVNIEDRYLKGINLPFCHS